MRAGYEKSVRRDKAAEDEPGREIWISRIVARVFVMAAIGRL
jgi:hypothetical protein